MDALLALIATYGLLVVFVSVFLDQGGLPVPAYPAVILTAALAVDRGDSILPILAVSTVAAVLADLLWFFGGRRFGVGLLRLMCKLSLSPDSCVTMTRDIYSRWGPPSLIGAKFVPGFAAVATTLAGENRTRVGIFLFYDALGALLWSGGAVLLGAIFHEAVNEVLSTLEALGRWGLPILLGLIAAFVAWKWWQRHRFLREIAMARISVPELHRLIADGKGPLILDVRSAKQRAEGWIPGARFVANLAEADLEPHDEVIVYCDCPNEASAAILAKQLRNRGFGRVRPLAGGFHAWMTEGHEVARDA
jgi:membrane protein DedA with SNARE-associated domain/rhodanese-related sulfurtransferase